MKPRLTCSIIVLSLFLHPQSASGFTTAAIPRRRPSIRALSSAPDPDAGRSARVSAVSSADPDARGVIISPSVAKADFLRLGEEASAAVAAGCGWLHCSVQDGVFVPKTSFGAPVVKALRKGMPESTVLDVKLSTVDPINRVPEVRGKTFDLFVFSFWVFVFVFF